MRLNYAHLYTYFDDLSSYFAGLPQQKNSWMNSLTHMVQSWPSSFSSKYLSLDWCLICSLWHAWEKLLMFFDWKLFKLFKFKMVNGRVVLLYVYRKDRKMALIQMSTVEEAVHALVVSMSPWPCTGPRGAVTWPRISAHVCPGCVLVSLRRYWVPCKLWSVFVDGLVCCGGQYQWGESMPCMGGNTGAWSGLQSCQSCDLSRWGSVGQSITPSKSSFSNHACDWLTQIVIDLLVNIIVDVSVMWLISPWMIDLRWLCYM